MTPGALSVDLTSSERTPILGGQKARCTAACPARWVLAFLGFLGILIAYAMRVNLSVALVAMVRKPYDPYSSDVTAAACRELASPIGFNNSTMRNESHYQVRGEFDWDSRTQGFILGAFFYGYTIPQIPGGIIAERYGAKWLFGIGILATSVFTLLTPIAARWNVWALTACRFVEGLGEGVTFPAMNALIGRWAPKLERSRMATFVFSGSPIGTVIGLAASGSLSDSTFLGGWPSVFYVFGLLGCMWFVLWIAQVYESPYEHPRITKAELAHIHRGQDHNLARKRPIPWKSILTSPRVIALIVTHFGNNWGFYTLLTEMPTYMSSVLHFDLKKNGYLSALPYLVQAICAILISFGADKLRATGKFRITTIRKCINSIAFFVPGICALIITFVDCNTDFILVLITISVGINGFIYSGFNVTHIDMSPEFSGTLMGITNCFSNFSGFLAPGFVGWIMQNGQTQKNWNIVFFTTSAVYFFSGTIYNLFASAEPQPWGTTFPDSQEAPSGNEERAASKSRPS